MRFIELYLSFQGRLSRGPYFIRGIQLAIFAIIPFIASIMLFKSGNVLWWVGVAVIVATIGVFAIGQASLIVRRLHDLGLSGYHAIWIGAAEFAGTFLSHATAHVAVLASPVVVINLWLLFYPGHRGVNRFGAQ